MVLMMGTPTHGVNGFSRIKNVHFKDRHTKTIGMKQLVPGPPVHDHTDIPIYKLYGYGNDWTTPDPLYCETIAAQEQLHNWHVTAHKHTGLFQLLFLESGGVTVRLDGEEKTVGPGHVVLVPQNVVHEFIFHPASGGHILTLTYALLHELCERLELALCAVTHAAVLRLGGNESDRHTALTFHQLNREYHSPHAAQRGPLLHALLSGILVWVHRHHQPQGPDHTAPDPGSQHLARYAQLVEEHYTGQHQVTWYAQHIGVTPAHLNTVVQTLVGKSALEFIHDRLLLEARRELIYTSRRISTIADSLGFADPGYFSRFFKRLTGVSPKDFRRQAHGHHPGAQA